MGMQLKLNKGDIKATQGDTGHAQPDMVTEIYAHILDEDRKVKAQRFEAGFYSRADLRGLEQSSRTQTVQNRLLAKIIKSVRIHLAARKSCGCQMETL